MKNFMSTWKSSKYEHDTKQNDESSTMSFVLDKAKHKAQNIFKKKEKHASPTVEDEKSVTTEVDQPALPTSITPTTRVITDDDILELIFAELSDSSQETIASMSFVFELSEANITDIHHYLQSQYAMHDQAKFYKIKNLTLKFKFTTSKKPSLQYVAQNNYGGYLMAILLYLNNMFLVVNNISFDNTTQSLLYNEIYESTMANKETQTFIASKARDPLSYQCLSFLNLILHRTRMFNNSLNPFALLEINDCSHAPDEKENSNRVNDIEDIFDVNKKEIPMIEKLLRQTRDDKTKMDKFVKNILSDITIPENVACIISDKFGLFC